MFFLFRLYCCRLSLRLSLSGKPLGYEGDALVTCADGGEEVLPVRLSRVSGNLVEEGHYFLKGFKFRGPPAAKLTLQQFSSPLDFLQALRLFQCPEVGADLAPGLASLQSFCQSLDGAPWGMSRSSRCLRSELVSHGDDPVVYHGTHAPHTDRVWMA